jgi:hypothetical protein
MAKAKINGPTKEPFDPTYQSECRFALEPSFFRLIDEAVKSGWPKQQVAYALMVMAARELSEKSKGELAQ